MEEPVFDEVRNSVTAEPTTTESTFGTTMVLGKGQFHFMSTAYRH